MARLILATAEGQQAIELRPVNSLGRHPNNSIQLLDKIVSKEHCILEQRDGMFVLRDLGSLNGTYINGERVRGEQLLRHGDEIALGSTRARYDDGSGPPLNYAQMVPGPGAVQHPQPAANWVPSNPMPGQGAGQGPMGLGGPQPVGSGVVPRNSPGAYGFAQSAVPAQPLGGLHGHRPPSFSGTRVDMLDSARAIGTQIAALAKVLGARSEQKGKR